MNASKRRDFSVAFAEARSGGTKVLILHNIDINGFYNMLNTQTCSYCNKHVWQTPCASLATYPIPSEMKIKKNMTFSCRGLSYGPTASTQSLSIQFESATCSTMVVQAMVTMGRSAPLMQLLPKCEVKNLKNVTVFFLLLNPHSSPQVCFGSAECHTFK